MTLIPLEQFLDSLETSAVENRRVFDEATARRKSTMEPLEQDIARLSTARDDEMRQRRIRVVGGESVKQIDLAIAKIDSDLRIAKEALWRVTNAEVEKPLPPFEMWNGGDRSVSALGKQLRQHGCKSAHSFPSAEALYADLPFSFVQVDDEGRPGAITIDVGSESIDLKVDVGSRFVAGHKPPSLSWVPSPTAVAVERSGAARGPMAVVLGAPPTWLVTRTKFFAHYETKDWSGRMSSGTEDVDFGNLVVSLRDHVAGESKKVEPLRLDGEAASVFAMQFRRRIFEATTKAPHYARTSERLTSLAISKQIASHWAKFVDAPWHRGIAGPLALLKHLVENREIPRFWNEEYSGHYGFRVRTRDHDWLVGDIFVLNAAQGDDQIRVESNHGPVVATIGAMHLRVGRSKE